jgi:DNA-binding transcriptional MerR regulator
VTGRTYLSIGDVLTLLRQEFPDVTISKIRFLESQGLVNPERTPSGYRKFYEHDVERLTWVLRQQREHFLPLKVIKGRLEEESSPGGGNGRELQPVGRELEGRISSRGSAMAEEQRPAPVLVAKRAPGPEARDHLERIKPNRTGGVVPPEQDKHPRLDDPGAPGPGAREPQSESIRPRGAQARGVLGQELPGFEGQEASGPALEMVTAPRPNLGAARGAGDVPDAVSESLGAAPRPATTVEIPAPDPGIASKVSGPIEQVASPKGSKADADAPSGGETSGMAAMGAFSGTSMTLEELAVAARIEPADVQQLESYGLIAGRIVGGVAYFDEDALTVASLAGAFARFGVEARHLRLHLLGAQREAGFIEQIVLPFLKQRNPASRQRAHETVAELSRLGQELRSMLLQKRLREQLGG